MSPRIQLDESVSDETTIATTEYGASPAAARQLLDADWENSKSEPLMLYVADEPRVGLEFSFHGLTWQIVDYRNGWVARMLVD